VKVGLNLNASSAAVSMLQQMGLLPETILPFIGYCVLFYLLTVLEIYKNATVKISLGSLRDFSDNPDLFKIFPTSIGDPLLEIVSAEVGQLICLDQLGKHRGFLFFFHGRLCTRL
jgi:hypothetical protein